MIWLKFEIKFQFRTYNFYDILSTSAMYKQWLLEEKQKSEFVLCN